jgi:hypothetical protein
MRRQTVPPPPTRFGPGAAQAKPASAAWPTGRSTPPPPLSWARANNAAVQLASVSSSSTSRGKSAKVTPSGAAAFLERMTEISKVPGGLSQHLSPFTPVERVVAPAKRDDFDKNGRATITALAGQTNLRKTVDGIPFEVVDLSQRFNDTPTLSTIFQQMFTAIGTAEVNYKNGPLHRNDEGKLPTADNGWRFIELYYCGGGTRLVIDVKTWTAFVSMHYGRFYVLSDYGRNPINGRLPLLVEIRTLSACYKSGNWDLFKRLYPAKVASLVKQTESS